MNCPTAFLAGKLQPVANVFVPRIETSMAAMVANNTMNLALFELSKHCGCMDCGDFEDMMHDMLPGIEEAGIDAESMEHWIITDHREELGDDGEEISNVSIDKMLDRVRDGYYE